jgi:hypothetical protein
MDFQLPDETTPQTGEAPGRTGGIFFARAVAESESADIIGADEISDSPIRARRRIRPLRTGAVALGAVAIGLVLYSSLTRDSSERASAGNTESSASIKLPPISLPAPNLLRPLSPDQAIQQNAERPFVNRPDSPASRFVLHTDALDRERALTCLAQAVYYEAAGEGVDGERAVAQVVLNRMRHPGYPASVCGVVYQGAARATGCQFTFACDGSLLRTPVPALWTRAREIAEQALSGHVFAPVGHATHYHADYVLPYWADSLDKSVQIGRHIFYRLPSVLGDARSFFQHYAGKEPELPQPKPADTPPDAVAAEQLASALIGDDPKTAAPQVERAAEPASILATDSSHGTLIADAQAPTITVHKSKSASECPAADGHKQVTALSANDLRSGVSGSRC